MKDRLINWLEQLSTSYTAINALYEFDTTMGIKTYHTNYILVTNLRKVCEILDMPYDVAPSITDPDKIVITAKFRGMELYDFEDDENGTN